MNGRILRAQIAVLVVALVRDAPALATLTDTLTRPRGFPNGLRDALPALADAFANNVGRSLPVIASSPGFIYEFDPEAGTPVRRASTGGSLVLEHADPLGKGHLALGLDYLHVQFDELDGRPLRRLRDDRIRIDGSGNPLFSLPLLGIDVAADEAIANVTYGVFDRVDVNLQVPFVGTSLERRVHIQVFGQEPIDDHLDDSAFGVGDVQLRAKAQLVATGPLLLSAGLGLRLPSGRKEDFQGTGDVEVTPMLIVSTATWKPSPVAWLQGHANLAMLLDADEVADRSEGRWGLGIDSGFGRWQLLVGLTGRHPTGPLFSESAIDALTTTVCAAPASQCFPTAPASRNVPYFGLSSERPNYVDGVLGIRATLWQDHLTAVVGMVAPLLDQGVVAEPIPIVGIEGVL